MTSKVHSQTHLMETDTRMFWSIKRQSVIHSSQINYYYEGNTAFQKYVEIVT